MYRLPSHSRSATAAVSIVCCAVFAFGGAVGCNNAFPVDHPTQPKVEAQSPEAPHEVEPPGFVVPEMAWEQQLGTRDWSLFSYNLILNKGSAMLRGAADVEAFCPRFYKLNANNRAVFWTALIAAISYYESAWDPTARMLEKTLGTDGITGLPVYSEGLLQLSYQDKIGHSYCGEFDWKSDRRMAPDDPDKTILQPKRNLACGIQILNEQIEKYGRIVIDSGAYWAVIKSSTKANKIEAIRRQTLETSVCH